MTGKADGDFTKLISKNGGSLGSMTVSITEISNGFYSVPLSTSHTDTLGVLTMVFTASGIKQVNLQYRVHARINDDLAYPATSGRSLQVEADGMVHADVKEWLGSAPNALVSGRVDSRPGALANDVITAASIAAGAIDAATFAAGAIDAAAIADNAIDYATFAADVYKLFFGAVLSSTAESGSTTTLTDTVFLDQADNDYWKGDYVLFTSGNIGGQCRLITGFDAGTDTITFAPAVTQAVSNQTYSIIPAARVDLHLWLGAVANALASGRVDASLGAAAANTITAAALAADAVNEVRDSILSDSTPFAGGNINATISSRATPAQVNAEVVDVLTVDAFAELASVPSSTSTLKDKIVWLFMLARNTILQTATTQTLKADDTSTTVATATVSDDGTTATRGEFT